MYDEDDELAATMAAAQRKLQGAKEKKALKKKDRNPMKKILTSLEKDRGPPYLSPFWKRVRPLHDVPFLGKNRERPLPMVASLVVLFLRLSKAFSGFLKLFKAFLF